MSTDAKVRLGLLLVSLAVSGFAALAIAHGFYLGPLDEVGGTTP